MPKESRVDILRNKIALYRRYLAAGVDSDLAPRYRDEIKRLQSELARIVKEGEKE
jgi:hypothetical protein